MKSKRQKMIAAERAHQQFVQTQQALDRAFQKEQNKLRGISNVTTSVCHNKSIVVFRTEKEGHQYYDEPVPHPCVNELSVGKDLIGKVHGFRMGGKGDFYCSVNAIKSCRPEITRSKVKMIYMFDEIADGNNNEFIELNHFASEDRKSEYAPICILKDQECIEVVNELKKTENLISHTYCLTTASNKITTVPGMYSAAVGVAFVRLGNFNGKEISSAKSLLKIYGGLYRKSGEKDIRKCLQMTLDSTYISTLLNIAVSKRNTLDIWRKDIPLKKDCKVLYVYPSLDELSDTYYVGELKPAITLSINGYYSVDNKFCCTLADIKSNSSVLLKNKIQLILCGGLTWMSLVPTTLRTLVTADHTNSISRSTYSPNMCVVDRIVIPTTLSKPSDNVNLSYDLEPEKKILIYSHKCHCSKCANIFGHDTIINCNAMVSTKKGSNAKVTVQYCTGCGNYFMNYETFEMYNQLYHGLLFECSFDNGIVGKDNPFGFAADSLLSRCGYSVKATENQSDRQAVLRYILDSKKATKWEITEMITGFIRVRQNMPNMQGAIARWREDIAYVANYNTQAQVSVGEKSFSQAGKIRK